MGSSPDSSKIDEMLEMPFKERSKDAVPEAAGGKDGAGEGQSTAEVLEYCKRIILDEKRPTHFDAPDALPGGWIKVDHVSGLPVYLHRKLQVCTLAKPFYIDEGSAENHQVPLSSIPCLARALEEEKLQQTGTTEKGEPVPEAGVLTAQENDGECHLSPEALREYAQKLLQPRNGDAKEKNLKKTSDKKVEEEEQSLNCCGSNSGEPNQVILNKLKGEMLMLKARQIVCPIGVPKPTEEFMTAQENDGECHLSPEALRENAQKVFKFKEIQLLHPRNGDAKEKNLKKTSDKKVEEEQSLQNYCCSNSGEPNLNKLKEEVPMLKARQIPKPTEEFTMQDQN